MPFSLIRRIVAALRNTVSARSTASDRASAESGQNWMPVATPAAVAASFASMTVSLRPPTRETIGAAP